MKELVTVVVPLLRSELTAFESQLLNQTARELDGFPFLFVSAEGVDVSAVTQKYPGSTTYTFADRYFQDRASLARLLLTRAFYEQFAWSEFILVHELNSVVCRNELRYWCRQGYDFIQPVSQNITQSTFGGPLGYLQQLLNSAPLSAEARFDLLQCGLSLRRVSTMQKVLSRYTKKVHDIKAGTSGLLGNDSLFWEEVSNKLWPALQVPTPVVRRRFAQMPESTPDQTNPAQQLFGFTGLQEQIDYSHLTEQGLNCFST
jgi:hypothetical protein